MLVLPIACTQHVLGRSIPLPQALPHDVWVLLCMAEADDEA